MTPATAQIKHRLTGKVLYTHEGETLRGADLCGAYLLCADLRNANLRSANLRSANLSNADLSGAYLKYANLSNANLRNANLSNANLSDANLSNANLSNADLRNANLHSANLSGAYLGGATVIDAGDDFRGYRYVAVQHARGPMIAAGCRWLPLSEARAHWTEAHAGDPALRAECLAKVDLIETVARERGWLEVEK